MLSYSCFDRFNLASLAIIASVRDVIHSFDNVVVVSDYTPMEGELLNRISKNMIDQISFGVKSYHQCTIAVASIQKITTPHMSCGEYS